MWVSFEEVPRRLSLEFVRGSHRWGVRFYFGPQVHDPRQIAAFPVPAIEEHRDSFDIVGWASEPGDIIAFHMSTLHGAQGGQHVPQCRRSLSLRWAGDDVRFTGCALPIPFPTDDWAGLTPGARVLSPLKPRVWPSFACSSEPDTSDGILQGSRPPVRD